MAYADKIVGRAWEASNKKGLKKILCAVGLEFSRVPMKEQFENISILENKLKKLQKSNKVLEKKLVNKMTEQDARMKKIERLIKDL